MTSAQKGLCNDLINHVNTNQTYEEVQLGKKKTPPKKLGFDFIFLFV